MRLRSTILAVAVCVSVTKSYGGVDPVTAAAVGSQTLVLMSTYDKRAKQQEKLAQVETAIAAGMAAIHNVEKTMLDYLTNVSGAVQNLGQIKRAAELIIAIPKNAAALTDAMKKHPKGAVFGTIISHEVSNMVSEAASLYPFMQQLVTTGTYNSGDKKHNVNLLNSAERYYVADMVVTKLSNINRSLVCWRYQIEYFRWDNLFYALDRESWAAWWGGKVVMESVISNWKSFKMRDSYR